MGMRLLPAYPLFVNNPYFSIWSSSDVLNESETIFWNGQEKKTYGVIYADGVCYSFLGNLEKTIKLTQNKVDVNLFSTDYEFECDSFILNISFINPLLLTELELMSRPVSYLSYKISPKKEIKNLKMALLLHQTHCFDRVIDYMIGGCFPFEDFEAAYFGLNRQHPMSHTGDSFSADWGYTYVTGKEAFFTSKTAVEAFVSTGVLEYKHEDREEEKFIVGIDSYTNLKSCVDGKFCVAFDDLCSIFYFGEWCKGYYFRNGKTIFDAIREANNDFELTLKKLMNFQNQIYEDLEAYDEDYKLLCNASFRQSIAAHALVETKDNELLFLSKECHSNGCIATVDITYPSMPLFLLYNPELVTAMTRPIYKFSKMPIWKFPYAPHDAGTFPYCLGQTYALKADEINNDKYLSNMFQRNRWNGIMVSHPMIYQFPEFMDIYNEENQMPIEECSNMLIIAYSSVYFGADDKTVKENYDLLKIWFEYLANASLIPTNQLCTDDFFERIDKNVNLSIKAIQAIKCFSLIAERFGCLNDKEEALKVLDSFMAEFNMHFSEKDHLPLSYYGSDDTYSLKYNLAYDKVLGTNLFSEVLITKELNHYLTKVNHFSIPLDHRSDLTKTDWIIYICSLTDDKELQKKLYKGVINFLKESECRVPFSDLYHVDNGIIKEFQNRPVQGATFMLLLKDKACKKN